MWVRGEGVETEQEDRKNAKQYIKGGSRRGKCIEEL